MLHDTAGPRARGRAAALVAAAWLVVACVMPVSGRPPARAQEPVHSTICAVQGATVTGTVSVEGVVTVGWSERLGGFFLEAAGCDDDPDTSDGIFVWAPSVPDVAAGTAGVATGIVNEYYGRTEIKLADWKPTGHAPVPEPVPLAAPADPAAAATYYETLEGMLVSTGPVRVVAATDDHGVAFVVPRDTGIARLFRDHDDGRRLGLEDTGPWLPLDWGDTLADVQGALSFEFGQYRVAVPRDGARGIVPAGRAPEPMGIRRPGSIRVATFNLENLFDAVDDPAKDDTVVAPEAYAAGRAARAAAIAAYLTDVDILAVQEVESLDVLEALAGTPPLADRHYAAILVDGPDARGIDVGFLYDPERWAASEPVAHQTCVDFDPGGPGTCTVPGQTGWDLFSRPPLEVTFREVATGRTVTVLANHFKSMSGGGAAARLAQAEAVLHLARDAADHPPDSTVIVAGDLNDFPASPPLALLTAGGLTDTHDLVRPEDDYTYVFDGLHQVLDYVLVAPGARLHGASPAHVNVDYAAPEPGQAPRAPRASDHDPFAITFDLDWHVFVPLVGWQPQPPARPTAPLPGLTPPPPTATPAGHPPRTPLRLDELHYDGTAGRLEPDEYVAFQNVAATTVHLAGWRLVSVRGDQSYTFPADAAIEPNQVCRVYTNEVHPEWCGLSWGSGQAVWNNDGDEAELFDETGGLVDWWCYGTKAGSCR